jgi:outer membrane cobalamin receptor
MKKSYKLLLFLFLVIGYVSHAQEPANTITVTDTTKKDTLNYYDMTIEQLLNLKAHGVPSELEKLINSLISVASKKPLNVRESPSIVSLVTAEEIKNSGARDLIDVLRLVPGIDFGVDVQGVVGIGMRGNWAHEGKVLILLDGQEMNEILYATTQFGNHFPIDQIKKIEIIRGPGSAIYGGYAEYGVINIVTKQGSDINGLAVSGVYGQTEKDYMRRNINLSAGKKTGDFEWSASGMIGQGQRSTSNYTDIYGSSYTMIGNSALNPAYANIGAAYKGLSFRALGDFYNTTTQDGYDAVYPKPYKQNFNSMYFELKYLWKIGKKLTITPKLNYKNQSPWKTPQGDSIDPSYLKTASRSTANITASYNPTRKINVVFGSEFYRDMAVDNLAGDTFYNGKTSVNFYNYAFFAQGLVKTRLVNIILGARYDKHNVYGDAFVPRVGLTKKYYHFNFKALYSNSFRAPAIENINLSGTNGIHPEKTQVIELEVGYQLTHNSIVTVNLYDIITKNPIIYYTVGSGIDAYTNQGKTGTRGLEAEYRVKAAWGYVTLNYSFYTAANKPKSDAYSVTADPNMLLGFASHKVNLNASINLTKNLSLNPSGTFYGPRWGYNSINLQDTLAVLNKFNSVFLFNLFLKYNTPVNGLSIGVGVYDIFNQQFAFIQPYAQPNSTINLPHAPLPGPPREFIFRLSYNLNFKAKTTK